MSAVVEVVAAAVAVVSGASGTAATSSEDSTNGGEVTSLPEPLPASRMFARPAGVAATVTRRGGIAVEEEAADEEPVDAPGDCTIRRRPWSPVLMNFPSE